MQELSARALPIGELLSPKKHKLARGIWGILVLSTYTVQAHGDTTLGQIKNLASIQKSISEYVCLGVSSYSKHQKRTEELRPASSRDGSGLVGMSGARGTHGRTSQHVAKQLHTLARSCELITRCASILPTAVCILTPTSDTLGPPSS